MRVFLSLVHSTSKPIHLILTSGDTIVSLNEGQFLTSVIVSLEAAPAVEGELSHTRHLWIVAGVGY